MEKVALVSRLRTYRRSTRGLIWPAAIWSDTREIENTTPMKVSIAELTVDTTLLAAEAKDSRVSAVCSAVASAKISRSIRSVRPASSTAPTQATNGANQNDSRRCSRSGDNAR